MTSVAVDGWALGGAASFRGVGTYARHVIGGLAGRSDVQVTTLASPGVAVPPGCTRQDVRRRAPGRWSLVEHEWRLPGDLARAHAAVVFEPAPHPPRRTPAPLVQTLHDVIPLVVADPDLAGERRRWRRWAGRYRSAAAVIAVSRCSADDGLRVLGLDPARLHVCHHGVDAEFTPASAASAASPVRLDDRPYVVTVGEYSRRKGFADAFRVAAELADRGFPHYLKVAGRIAPWVASGLRGVLASAPRPDRVELLGFVDDLPALYRGAAAYVGTSHYEGFGLPALEAMACGTPVVAFDSCATVEIVGQAGILVPDGDAAALAAGVASVLQSSGQGLELSAAGLARAAPFTWEASVRTHAEIIAAVARR